MGRQGRKNDKASVHGRKAAPIQPKNPSSGAKDVGAPATAPTVETPPMERQLDALRERGETAIASFLSFAFGAPILLSFAHLLRAGREFLSPHLGALADPVEKVLSLMDSKPVSAVLAFALLQRGVNVLFKNWMDNQLLLDWLDALYAVTFSLLGFMAGAGILLAMTDRTFALLARSFGLAAVCFVVFVATDIAFIKADEIFRSFGFRLAAAIACWITSASILYIG